MNRHHFLPFLLTALCQTACVARADLPVVRDVVRDARSPSDQSLAWSLFQQVRESLVASLDGEARLTCMARHESKDTEFVNGEMRSRTQDDIQRVDFINYENGITDVELYVRTSEPSAGNLVLYVREHSSSCIAFDIQILVSEEGGY